MTMHWCLHHFMYYRDGGYDRRALGIFTFWSLCWSLLNQHINQHSWGKMNTTWKRMVDVALHLSTMSFPGLAKFKIGRISLAAWLQPTSDHSIYFYVKNSRAVLGCEKFLHSFCPPTLLPPSHFLLFMGNCSFRAPQSVFSVNLLTGIMKCETWRAKLEMTFNKTQLFHGPVSIQISRGRLRSTRRTRDCFLKETRLTS